MKIVKKLLILFTSIFTLAIASSVSVFFIEHDEIQKPIVIDFSTISKIKIPKIKSERIQRIESQINDEISAVQSTMVQRYQREAFGFYKNQKSLVAKSISTPAPKDAKEIISKETKKMEKENYPVSILAKLNKVENNAGEINTKQLIQHNGFDIETSNIQISWAQEYEMMNVAEILKDLEINNIAQVEMKVDQVGLALASNKKDELDDKWEDEIVFIDYSEVENKTETPQLNIQKQVINSLTDHMDGSTRLPSSVLNVINRESGKRQDISTNSTIDLSAIELASQAQVTEYSYGKSVAAAAETQTPALQNDYSAMNTPSRSTRATKRSINILSIHEANIDGVNTQKELRNFEFNAEVMSTQRLTDDVKGKIRIEETLNGDHSILRGTLLKHGYMRTKIDLVLENGEYQLNIPLISQNTFGDFLDKESLIARGGFVLVQMPKDANTVDIDRTYEAKIHLNSKFKVVEYEDDFEYVLYVGVNPGNMLLTYTNFRGQKAQKITHVVEDEVLFEGAGFVMPKKLSFSLTQKNMLGSQTAPYNIYADRINFFNSEIEAQQEAVATYGITTPLKPMGARNYLEIKEGRYPIFVGLWNQRKIELPSDSFASYILESHQLRSLENACLIQVNLSKPVEDVAVYGETEQGQMGIIQTYLDKDGQFNYEATQMASHLFLVGDSIGVISLKIKYVDKTIDYLQTFCSNNTYLVEQL